MEKLSLKLEVFEGPLDLLLHLITKNKINIYDIPIIEITSQYLDYIYQMSELDLEMTSDFLVMASTLILIKSKMLLPSTKDEAEELKEELIEKLLEFKRYKEMLGFFKQQEEKGTGLVTKNQEKLDFKIDYEYKNANISEMLLCVNELLKRIDRQKPPTKEPFKKMLEHKVYSVEEKRAYILGALSLKGKMEFMALFGNFKARGEVIAAFIAVLELIKENFVRARFLKSKIFIVSEA